VNLEVLRSVSFLKQLNPEELDLFSNLLTLRPTQVREQIVQEGKEATALYLIIKGTAHVRRMAQKREVLLGRLPKGGFFGEINLFDPGLATASVYAMEAGELACVTHKELRQFMQQNPQIGYKIVSGLMTELCRRMRQTNDRLVHSFYWASLNEGKAGQKSTI
jgi:CRP/FNR family transcriptional regulator, cyclic AMP receptor protein